MKLFLSLIAVLLGIGGATGQTLDRPQPFVLAGAGAVGQ